jgi:5-hydroxyisourate hydrolase-like protein (transthyretin family)
MIIPKGFSVRQNYPNPFNPTTTIEYALPRSVRVKVDLYNTCGQFVERLVDRLDAAGNHRVVVDGRNLASGVYLYRFQAGAYTQTKKLILLK